MSVDAIVSAIRYAADREGLWDVLLRDVDLAALASEIAAALARTPESPMAVEDSREFPMAVEHSCEFCEINVNHPRCPENAIYAEVVTCPHCGSDPEDCTIHAEGCPTLGTCASTAVNLPKPWHPEPERWTKEWWDEHMRTEHPGLAT